MPRQRLSVRKIREILRLRCDSRLSARQIARSCGLARSTVAEYLRRAKECGLTWPLPEGLDDIELERRLFPAIPVASDTQRPEPNWPLIHKELRRKGVTLNLLWQEYRAVYSDGYQYSWFCEHYRGWAGKVDLVMRQEHRAGEKLFVDYAGQAVGVIDRRTGEVRDAQIFVAVLGASSYAYAEATWTQTLPDWIGSHVRAFTYLGGCPEILVPDNLKSGVTSPHLYEPDLNPTYQDYVMAALMLRKAHKSLRRLCECFSLRNISGTASDVTGSSEKPSTPVLVATVPCLPLVVQRSRSERWRSPSSQGRFLRRCESCRGIHAPAKLESY